MFYRVDSTRVTLREYWWDCRNPLAILLWLTKWLWIRLPASVDDPPVDSLASFEVAEADIPDEVLDDIDPICEQLEECGFHSPVFHAIDDGYHQTSIHLATFLHESGQAVARIHRRIWTFTKPPKKYLFPTFLSVFGDGTSLVSSAGKPDLLAPDSCQIGWHRGANVDKLWREHEEQLDRQPISKVIRPIRNRRDLCDAVEDQHAAVRDFHVDRGVFVPMTAEEEARALSVTLSATGSTGTETDTETALVESAVLAEIDRQQNKRPGWGNAVFILVLSVLLFLGAGSARWSWDFVLMLIPILFIHELGHFVAMRAFRYRNVKMFFIPLFGAAVSGSNYNVAGWKKAIVSLAGPLPGIALAIGLGTAALVFEIPLMLNVALLTLFLNGLNLLPVLPLDGGWVMHTTLFSRHHLLDAAFRVIAAVALFAGSMAVGDRILPILGIFMLMGVPTVWRMGRIVKRLRPQLPAVSADEQSIPPETARAIIHEVRNDYPQTGLNTKTIAVATLQIFESLNARPPGWIGTIGLLGIHFCSLVVAVVASCVFVIGQQADLRDFIGAAAAAPQNVYTGGSTRVWSGANADQSAESTENTIIATFSDSSQADDAYADLSARLPETATLRVFGQSLLLALPADDDASRKRWLAELESRCDQVAVNSQNFLVTFTATFIAPNADVAEDIEDQAKDYFGVLSSNLIPPWSPEHALTPAYEKARRTYRKLEARGEVDDSPQLQQLSRRAAEAMRRGDREAQQKIQQEQNALWEQSRQQHIDSVREEGERLVDTALIDIYRQCPQYPVLAEAAAADGETEPAGEEHRKAVEEYHKQYQEWQQKLGERMGQLPMDNGQPVPGVNRHSTSSGSVTRAGLLLRFNWLTFARPVDGVASFTDWLNEKGRLDFKYEFHTNPELWDELDE